MPRKRIIYGNANYADFVQKNGYFVDKTAYIAKLERVENPIFLRPRRFGKSMLCSLLKYYYDLNEAPHFEQLFSETWIGQNPTGNQNRNITLYSIFRASTQPVRCNRLRRNLSSNATQPSRIYGRAMLPTCTSYQRSTRRTRFRVTFTA